MDPGSPSAPLMASAGAELPELMAPSAPPAPTILFPEEFNYLLDQLPKGCGELPPPEALEIFRVLTCNKLLWAAQVREIAATVEGGKQLMREAYERQLLLDPQTLTAADGEWVNAMPNIIMQAAQALMSPVTVIRYDGKVTQVSVDMGVSSAHEVMKLAGERLGGDIFDPEKHIVFAVGQPLTADLSVGSPAKVTGLMQNEELNGMIGQIISIEGDQCVVHLPTGSMKMHKDNVVPHYVTVVVRNCSFYLEHEARLMEAGVGPGSRLMWLEADKDKEKDQVKHNHGCLRAIRAQFYGMDMSHNGNVSAGELRNFLWNLNLDDDAFVKVKQRFAPQSDYVEVEDIMFLLGRPHLQNQAVPVDALVYEAVVSILGRRTTAHIDKKLHKEDHGVGCKKACADHCPSYATSLILQGVVFFDLVYLLLDLFVDEVFHTDDASRNILIGICAVAYVVYLLHLMCCVGLTKAFHNETEGMEAVVELMDKPRHENPRYSWTVQCYHYRTVHYTTTDKDGRTQHHTRQERVNTHHAHTSGFIPSTDMTPPFLPQVEAQQTQIDTHLNLDLSQSNYHSEYQRFCAFHRWDVHQDCSHSEDCPSRAGNCLAVWVAKSKPCWMNGGCYWLANIFLLSFFYRLAAQRLIGKQEYTYHKKCYSLGSMQHGHRGMAGAAAVGGALVGAVAVGGILAAMA